jgi:hypothetical protein
MEQHNEQEAAAMTHELKTWPEYFQKVKSGEKTFEVRKLDRFFNEGDTLILKEWSPVRWQETNGYSGDQVEMKVTYVMNGGKWDIPEGICIMGIRPTQTHWKEQLKESWKHFEGEDDFIYFIEQNFSKTNGYDVLLKQHQQLGIENSLLESRIEELKEDLSNAHKGEPWLNAATQHPPVQEVKSDYSNDVPMWEQLADRIAGVMYANKSDESDEGCWINGNHFHKVAALIVDKLNLAPTGKKEDEV